MKIFFTTAKSFLHKFPLSFWPFFSHIRHSVPLRLASGKSATFSGHVMFVCPAKNHQITRIINLSQAFVQRRGYIQKSSTPSSVRLFACRQLCTLACRRFLSLRTATLPCCSCRAQVILQVVKTCHLNDNCACLL